MREIKLQINDRTYKYESSAISFGDLRSEINEKFENVNNMAAFEGYTQQDYTNDSVILPKSVTDYNGRETTSLLFMFTDDKKFKNGSVFDTANKFIPKSNNVTITRPTNSLTDQERIARLEEAVFGCDVDEDEDLEDEFEMAKRLRSAR